MEELDLVEQSFSSVRFPGTQLNFSNDEKLLEEEIAKVFPECIDAFRHWMSDLPLFDDIKFTGSFISARETLLEKLANPLLVEMLLLPTMFYGSATENDLHYGHFVILFRSIFVEGLARPQAGIRPLLRILTEKFRDLGGERHLNTAVSNLIVKDGQVKEIVLKSGQSFTADTVLSSVGYAETLSLAEESYQEEKPLSRLSFVETITMLDKSPADLGFEDTLIFYNMNSKCHYRIPDEDVDTSSGVICMPNNYQLEEDLPDGVFRMTCLANYEKWKSYSEEEYENRKHFRYEEMHKVAAEVLKCEVSLLPEHSVEKDMFTPRTVEKFTSHWKGAIYGSPRKVHDAKTPYENLFVIGSDHGMVGIVGTMLSGILVANSRVLQAP